MADGRDWRGSAAPGSSARFRGGTGHLGGFRDHEVGLHRHWPQELKSPIPYWIPVAPLVPTTRLLDPHTHRGQTYTLTGPAPSSPREQVAILAELLNRPLAAEEVSIEQAQSALLGAGWPAWSVERMGELFRLYADGLAADVSPDIERVTGRPARSYRQFAAEHRDAFLASS